MSDKYNLNNMPKKQSENDKSIFVGESGATFGGAAAELMHARKEALKKRQRGILVLDRQSPVVNFFIDASLQYRKKEAEARDRLRQAKSIANENIAIEERKNVALAVYKRMIAEELLKAGELDGEKFANKMRELHQAAFNEEMYWQAYNDMVNHLNN